MYDMNIYVWYDNNIESVGGILLRVYFACTRLRFGWVCTIRCWFIILPVVVWPDRERWWWCVFIAEIHSWRPKHRPIFFERFVRAYSACGAFSISIIPGDVCISCCFCPIGHALISTKRIETVCVCVYIMQRFSLFVRVPENCAIRKHQRRNAIVFKVYTGEKTNAKSMRMYIIHVRLNFGHGVENPKNAPTSFDSKTECLFFPTREILWRILYTW